MNGKITLQQLRKFSITTGVVFDASYLQAVFSNDAEIAANPETRHGYLGSFRGTAWVLNDFPYPVRSQARITKPEDCIISITDQGTVRRTTPAAGGTDEAKMGTSSGRTVLGRTLMLEVRAIDGFAYAVGTQRSAYRRIAPNKWDCIDAGCYAAKDFESGFQSIHGYSGSEIYAVGNSGEIWEYDGKHWKEHDSGTNAVLNKVLCAPDGFVYAAGDAGTILKGRHDAWTALAGIPSDYDFWGMQDYKGKIYLTANTSLIMEMSAKGAVRPVDFGDCDIATTAYHLTVGAGSLYSFGAKHIRKFDGTEWEDVLSLD
jgi:hypothetical protein